MIPLPNEDVTPPVTNIYFVIILDDCITGHKGRNNSLGRAAPRFLFEK